MPSVRHPQALCRYGFAHGDITPPVGIYHRMWGAATHDQSTGVHRPLTASAMLFQPTGSSEILVIIAVDHVLLWANEMDGLLQAIADDTGLSKEVIQISFSHTHAAGLMGMERATLPGGDLIPDYLATMAKQISQLVLTAKESVQSASITYGHGRCSLAAHRDFFDAETNQFVCGFNPGAPADDTLMVARVHDLNGQAMTVIVNYACHPTTLAWDNTLISPDFPGACCEVVSQASKAPCVYIQGASGDLGPREGFVGDTEVADRNGRQLGYAVLSVLESLPPPLSQFTYAGPVISGATIGTWKHEPLENRDGLSQWDIHQWTVDLPYRSGLPTADAVEQEMKLWEAKEQEAVDRNDQATARDHHAMVERLRRKLIHTAALPTGDAFPFPVTLWQAGDALWVWVEAEPYNLLQRALRERFPEIPIFVGTLTNGSRPSYLPSRDAYDKGIYQETISPLAAGSLEILIDAIAEQIQLRVDASA